MKVWFWILLALNALLFAVMQWGSALLGDGQTVHAQPALREEKIRLADAPQSAPEAPQPASAVAVAAAESAPAPAPVLALTPALAPAAVSAPAPAPAPSKPAVCMEWGDLSGRDLTRAHNALSALHLGDKLSQRQVEHNIGYWVYIPPLKDKESVNQKIEQLKARGIEEYFVVQDAGQWQGAISLGVFKTRDAAQAFRESLIAKDVRSAQVGERASKLKATVFVLTGLDAATGNKVSAIQKDYSGTELKRVSCR
ncbi:MAG TPA: SPOR domain-containing protein [Gallionella sp.]|nr:SPOR domain-containing protein [Gallionella sp.]